MYAKLTICNYYFNIISCLINLINLITLITLITLLIPEFYPTWQLLVYRSAELASSMSAVNSRPTDTITHSSLAHALRYQQIESVNFCLNKAISGTRIFQLTA